MHSFHFSSYPKNIPVELLLMQKNKYGLNSSPFFGEKYLLNKTCLTPILAKESIDFEQVSKDSSLVFFMVHSSRLASICLINPPE